jgi:hypothetical protein
LKELLERAMWKSVSMALTVVELVEADGGGHGGAGRGGQRDQWQGSDAADGVSDGVHGGPLRSMLL